MFYVCSCSTVLVMHLLFSATKILHSWFVSQEQAVFWRWETIAGVIAGFSTSLISISFIKLLQQMKSRLPQLFAARVLPLYMIRFRRTCFLVAYISFMSWLAIQYGKRLGLLEIITLLKKQGQHSFLEMQIPFCLHGVVDSANLELQQANVSFPVQ